MAKQSRYRYSIGIDLGTSNCALAYIDLKQAEGASGVLPVSQWVAPNRSSERELLPSFAYYPKSGEFENDQLHVIGELAREMSVADPQRVVSSAKSWLAHAGVDRNSRILPWGSDEIPDEKKLSPVEAAALYLGYLRSVWDQQMRKGEERNAFHRQHIVITVPASFDQTAQKLTLEAAKLAGYPDHVRLLEEPQAAFHAWLERHPGQQALRSALGAGEEEQKQVLVCDIGGGTSDFSRFEITFRPRQSAMIRRVAVSDHILLGGDNIDMAIAHKLETSVSSNGEKLDPRSWQKLVAEGRKLKEKALGEMSSEGGVPEDTVYQVGVSASGGGLFQQAKTARISAGEIVQMLEGGFFPECESKERAQNAEAGFREMGLPFAKDPAITRHLAGFVDEGGQVDAVLFNGGAMTPVYLQNRMTRLIGSWQNSEPALLENSELGLAVAKGAASYGASLATGEKAPITGGAGHGYYLEIAAQDKNKPPYLLCILPQGTESEQVQRIHKLDLHLAINRPVEFRLYDSPRRTKDHAGSLLKHSTGNFRRLPALRTVARMDQSRAKLFESGNVPVDIQAVLNSLGLLQVFLVTSDKKLSPPEKWELEFDMRAIAENADEGENKNETQSQATSAGNDDDREEHIPGDKKQLVSEILENSIGPGVLGKLEKVLQKKRAKWPRSWLRQMWESLHPGISSRGQGPDFESAWMNAAGFLLRPGFGMVLDDFRIDQLWNVNIMGIENPRSKEVKAQYWLMWRRVAGGLDGQRQLTVYEEARSLIESHSKRADEAVGMASSFERLPPDDREQLLDVLLQGVEHRGTKHIQHHLWALGRLLSRVPLYAGEESVLPPESVRRCWEFFREWDWSDPRAAYLPTLFSQACRITDHRGIDVSPDLRGAVAEKMRSAGASEKLMLPVNRYVAIEREDLDQLFGEKLPLGLAIKNFS